MRVAIPYRSSKLMIFLIVSEYPFTVAILALFGIASPNLYRTRLWQDGADNGFNSSPSEILYSYANYRPISTPKVWSQFITSFNVVIAVLGMFIMLCKTVMYIVHCWPPILSLFMHALLVSLYSVSVAYQSASDMSDPAHPQRGPPWYITKSCSVTAHPSNIGYCKQAKSAFIVTCFMLGIFCIHVIHAIVSMIWPGKSEDDIDESSDPSDPTEEDGLKSPEYRDLPTPGSTRAMKSPMTPRSQAFNKLGGTKDLPLRNHFSSPTPRSPTYNNFSGPSSPGQPPAQMYFPPPPKAAVK